MYKHVLCIHSFAFVFSLTSVIDNLIQVNRFAYLSKSNRGSKGCLINECRVSKNDAQMAIDDTKCYARTTWLAKYFQIQTGVSLEFNSLVAMQSTCATKNGGLRQQKWLKHNSEENDKFLRHLNGLCIRWFNFVSNLTSVIDKLI